MCVCLASLSLPPSLPPELSTLDTHPLYLLLLLFLPHTQAAKKGEQEGKEKKWSTQLCPSPDRYEIHQMGLIKVF